MTKPIANPRRFVDLSTSEDPQDVGQIFRSARELRNEELPKLRWRLRTSLHRRATRPSRLLRLAFVTGVVFCVGGVVGAVVSPLWKRKESPAPAKEPVTPAGPSIKRGSMHSSTIAPVPDDPRLEEAKTTLDESTASPKAPRTISLPAKPAPHRRAAVAATLPVSPAPDNPPESAPAAPAPAAPSAIAVEQALLADALKALRDGHDAEAALALLARHEQQFPNGALWSEATMVRIEALLDLGRQNEALSLLDKASLAALPNRDEQLVVRGELRAAKGRWQDAKQDFDQMLQQQSFPAASPRVRSLRERALWGRGAARSRLGDHDGARRDLELYLRQFPDGRFAKEAASLLKGTP